MKLRAAIFGATFLGLSALAIGTWTRGEGLTAPERLLPGQPYDVILNDGRATVDLYLEAETAVRLVASNLGSANRNATLQARATPVAGRPQFLPVAYRRRGDNPARLQLENIGSKTMDRNVLSTSASRPAATSPPPPTRDFWLHVTEAPLENPQGYQLIHGRLASFRESVEVYAEASSGASENALAIQQLADDIAERLSRDVLPTIHEHVGPIADPDQNGRLTVLLTPWLGRLRGGTTQVRGFVRSSDLRTDIAAPFSNHADLVYLNADLPSGEALQTLLLHEVAHTALASRQSAADQTPLADWDDWLNEGLAHLAERQGPNDWSNADYRVARYWQNPGAAPLAVRDYYRTGRWRNHGCRGATCLFLDWCQQSAQRRGVTHFIRALMATGRSDAEAIELVCGMPLEDLYRDWTVALAVKPRGTQQLKIGRFLNSGPRFQTWGVDTEATREFDVAGSATQFIDLRASHSGWYRLQFEGDPLDAWQLTAVPCTQPSPEISLHARWSRGDTAEQLRLLVQTRIPLPAGWQWEEISCELIREPQPRVWSWSAASLAISGAQTFAVPLPMEVAGTDAVVKVRMQNEAGQIAWAWVDVPERRQDSSIHVSRRP